MIMITIARKPQISIILPCRNEEKALGQCLDSIKEVIAKNRIDGEIVVSDSSVDDSPLIAKRHHVKLIKHNQEGYGRAYLEGFKAARGKYLFLADADGSYDFNEIPKFINRLEQGFDFVIGNRFKGNIEEGAMPWLHRYVGNPILSFLLRLFFRADIHDVHCGMRAIKRESLEKLNLSTSGMEFASEMIVKVVKNKLKVSELAINYKKRLGKSKLRSFVDGWRHLRFMLLYSPLYLFFIPGVTIFLLGLVSMGLFYFGLTLFGITLYYHPMFVSSILLILGYQIIIFSLFAKIYANTHLGENNQLIENLYRYITIEKGMLAGALLGFFGCLIIGLVSLQWIQSGFGSINEVKSFVVALTLMTLGVQTVFSSFMFSILGIKEK